MSLKKLYESIDANVLTESLKAELKESFDAAVELKAAELAESKIDEKIKELDEKAEGLKETLIAEAAEKDAALLDTIDAYLEKVVEEFTAEAKEQLDESIKQEKADLMIEAFDAMLTAGGVEVAKIVEAKEADDVETKLAESVEKYDDLVEEVIDLKKENDKLIKMGVIAEMKEGLSIVEAEKFAKLADLVEFSKDEGYLSKLETIKESVKGAKEEKVDESLNENNKETKPTVSYSHLL